MLSAKYCKAFDAYAHTTLILRSSMMRLTIPNMKVLLYLRNSDDKTNLPDLALRIFAISLPHSALRIFNHNLCRR